MGKFKRIPVKDINAMRKILDDLPDKNLGKTREEAAELLNANILLVDTDTDNPDVFKAHKDLALPNLLCRLNSLDDADGWAELLDTVQNYPDYAVVINAAARTKTSTASYGDIMKEALREMRRELTVFWIINRHRDSVELLHSFQEVFTDVPIHVCRNLYFGEARRFDMYNSSKAREAVEKNGMTLDFPAVAGRVADWLYSKRMSIRAAQPEMPFGTRAELQRWRTLCAKMFESVMGEAS